MGLDTRCYVWPTDSRLEQASGARAFKGGWLEVDAAQDAQGLSREAQTAAVAFEIHTATNAITIEFFVHGRELRALSYSSDDGWAKRGRSVACEDAAEVKRWLGTRRVLASPDGYEVLEAVLGCNQAPKPKFLALIAAPPPVRLAKGWDFGGVLEPFLRGKDVNVAGYGRVTDGLSVSASASPRAPLTIELTSSPLQAPVAWKDVGLFWGQRFEPKPYVPTEAQLRTVSDDMLEYFARAQAERAKVVFSFLPTEALRRALGGKPVSAPAPRTAWEPWLPLPDVDGPEAPLAWWERRGDAFVRAVGEDWVPITISAPLYSRALRCTYRLRAALGENLLSGEALGSLATAWHAAGLPLELVVTLLADC